MLEFEERGLPYLFKLRHTTKVRTLVKAMMGRGELWQDCGDGWQALESSLKLDGWTRERRVTLVRENPAQAPVAIDGKARHGKEAVIRSDDSPPHSVRKEPQDFRSFPRQSARYLSACRFVVSLEEFLCQSKNLPDPIQPLSQRLRGHLKVRHHSRRLAAMNLAIQAIEIDFGSEHSGTFRRALRPDTAKPNPRRHLAGLLRSERQLLVNGSISSNLSGEGDIHRALIDADLADGVLPLPSQLFYSTRIPSASVSSRRTNLSKLRATPVCLMVKPN